MVASDLDRLRDVLAQMERLAANHQLTMTRYFELARDALTAAGEDVTQMGKVIEYGTRLSPDIDRLRLLAAEVSRLGQLGALTPTRFELLFEQALVAVGEHTDLLELFPEFRGRQ